MTLVFLIVIAAALSIGSVVLDYTPLGQVTPDKNAKLNRSLNFSPSPRPINLVSTVSATPTSSNTPGPEHNKVAKFISVLQYLRQRLTFHSTLTPVATPVPVPTPSPTASPSPNSTPISSPSPSPKPILGNPTFSLNPGSANLYQGCNFSVDVNLDTAGYGTDGADAVLIFDASKINVVLIEHGKIYSEYLGLSFDNFVGRVSITGLANISTPYNGSGKFATVKFKVLTDAEVGPTQIKFDFDPNNKQNVADSNITTRYSGDVLFSVTNGSYSIGKNACS